MAVVACQLFPQFIGWEDLLLESSVPSMSDQLGPERKYDVAIRSRAVLSPMQVHFIEDLRSRQHVQSLARCVVGIDFTDPRCGFKRFVENAVTIVGLSARKVLDSTQRLWRAIRMALSKPQVSQVRSQYCRISIRIDSARHFT
jgi:hypothetical protein